MQIKKAGLSAFSELLKLLATTTYTVADIRKANTATDTTAATGTPTETSEDDLLPCLYCPRQFASEEVFAVHLAKCKETPNTDTVIIFKD